MNKLRKFVVPLVLFAASAISYAVPALAEGGEAEIGHGSVIPLTFLWLAVIILVAKLASFIERWGQPAVLGELVVGIILGNLALFGLPIFEPIRDNELIAFLAELGVVILLFKVGLESNIQKMRKVGVPALLVATIGVVVPFVLGTYVVGPWLFPGLNSNTYLFLGAALTATSVGITARVFADLKKLHLPEAQVVLGAAVIDDVMGLIILAVVTAIATTGGVTIGAISWITAKAILFLVGSVVVGGFAAPALGKLFSKIQSGLGMKVSFSLVFMLVGAYLAHAVGLAPIVGAFSAGLVLDPVHFKSFRKPKVIEDMNEVVTTMPGADREKFTNMLEHHADKHIEDYIEDIGHFLIPVFFVVTGFGVRLESLANSKILVLALAVTLVAIIGKLVAGIAASQGMNKWLVGVGMVPRGEVGLIFAAIGQQLGVLSHELFSVIVIMVIFTTLLPPPVLSWLLKRQEKAQNTVAAPVTL